MEKLALFGCKPERDSFLPLAYPDIGNEEIEQVLEVLKSKWIIFQQEICKIMHNPFVHNGLQ